MNVLSKQAAADIAAARARVRKGEFLSGDEVLRLIGDYGTMGVQAL